MDIAVNLEPLTKIFVNISFFWKMWILVDRPSPFLMWISQPSKILVCQIFWGPPKEIHNWATTQICIFVNFSRFLHVFLWQISSYANNISCDKKSDEGSNSVRMRHENSGASKMVENWLSTRLSESSDAQLSDYGVKIGRFGRHRDHFLPKNGLKTAILGDPNI